MYRIIIFQGPSASGKSTLQAMLGLPRVVTWTSRPPRDGEKHGQHYFFATREVIESMYREGGMAEMSTYHGELYGTSLRSLQEAIEGGTTVSTVMDAQGAAVVKNLFPDQTLLIGIAADREHIHKRLLERRSSPEEIERRLRGFDQETQSLGQCDLIINNNDEQLQKAEAVIQLLKQALLR